MREQLRQLHRLRADGVLGESAYGPARDALERRLVDALVAGDGATAPQAAPGRLPRPRRWWWIAAAGVVVTVLSGYVLLRPEAVPALPAAHPPLAASPAGPPASAPHDTSGMAIADMVARLEARLQSQPDDAEGWGMLGRSYMALKRYPEAATAYGRAVKLRPSDASLLADLADVRAVLGGRSLEGEPRQLLEQALKLEPANLKALVLLGTAAYQRGDFGRAIVLWERAVQQGPADSPLTASARDGLVEARQHLATGAAPWAAQAAPASAGTGRPAGAP